MTTCGILFAGRNIAVSVFLLFFLLDQVNVCQHDGLFIGILLIRLGPRPILRCLLHYPPPTLGPARASFRSIQPLSRRVRDDLSYILTSANRSASKLLARARSQCTAFLSGGASTALGFMSRNTTTSEFVSSREKPFPRVAFANKLFVFVAELIPKGMKGFVVGPVNNVAEPGEMIRRFSKVGTVHTHAAWCQPLPP